MTEEVSETTKIAVLCVFMSGFLTNCIVIFLTANMLLTGFTDGIGQTYSNVNMAALYEMAAHDSVSGPQCFSNLSNRLEVIAFVECTTFERTADGDIAINASGNPVLTKDVLWEFRGAVATEDKISRLFTVYSSKNYKVTITDSIKGKNFVEVYLVEVE